MKVSIEVNLQDLYDLRTQLKFVNDFFPMKETEEQIDYVTTLILQGRSKLKGEKRRTERYEAPLREI